MRARRSLKRTNRSLLGSIAGPSAGLIDDASSVMGFPQKMIKGDEITQGQKNAAERLLPFSSYLGFRFMLRYLVKPQQPGALTSLETLIRRQISLPQLLMTSSKIPL
jgi:hypothetical protein